MNVLVIGTDRKLFDKESVVRARVLEYATLFDQLHIVVFSLKGRDGYRETERIGTNIWIYPTNSWTRLSYVFDALTVVGRQLVFNGKLKADVVSAQDPFEVGLAAWIVARRFKKKLHLQIHTDLFNTYFKKLQFTNRIRLVLARFLLRKADCVRVVSEKIKRDIEKKYGHLKGKVDVLPVYVDLSHIRDKEPVFDLHEKYPQFKFIVLMASRLAEEKNIAFALDVLKNVLKHYQHTGLVIVGEGPEKRTLQKKAQALSIQDHVVFESWQDDLVSYFKTANVFLSTSVFEGYGMTLIEAAACGIPVISSDVGIATNLSKEHQGMFVCPVGDKECFVRQIKSFISSHEKRVYFNLNVKGDLGGLVCETKERYLKAYQANIKRCFKKENI